MGDESLVGCTQKNNKVINLLSIPIYFEFSNKTLKVFRSSFGTLPVVSPSMKVSSKFSLNTVEFVDNIAQIRVSCIIGILKVIMRLVGKKNALNVSHSLF